MAFQPGISGNPKGRPKKQRPLPAIEQSPLAVLEPEQPQPAFRNVDPALLSQPREKQAEDLRQGAYYIAKRCELKLHSALDNDAKNLWDDIRAWGTAADKVLLGVEGSGLSLFVPAALLDKFALALRIGTHDAPQAIDITPKT